MAPGSVTDMEIIYNNMDRPIADLDITAAACHVITVGVRLATCPRRQGTGYLFFSYRPLVDYQLCHFDTQMQLVLSPAICNLSV